MGDVRSWLQRYSFPSERYHLVRNIFSLAELEQNKPHSPQHALWIRSKLQPKFGFGFLKFIHLDEKARINQVQIRNVEIFRSKVSILCKRFGRLAKRNK